MPEKSPDSDSGVHTMGRRDGATTGMSRWQKAVAIIGVVVVLWVASDLADIVTSSGEGPTGGHGRDGQPAIDHDGEGRPGGPGGVAPAGEVPTSGAPTGRPHNPSDYDHG